MNLLLRLLTPEQREEFVSFGYFTVAVARRGKFVILPDAMFNVLDMVTGNCYCAIPATGVPIADLMLAQKLLLESDPDQFFRAANVRPEVVVGLRDDEPLPERVLRARRVFPNPRVRCSEVSMIPHWSSLP